MTDQEKQKAIIEQAVRNGYQEPWRFEIDYDTPYFNGKQVVYGSKTHKRVMTFTDIIFDHAFLKAFFGEIETIFYYEEQVENEVFGGTLYYPYDEGAAIVYKGVAWRYYAQQLAVAESRIDYLYQFVKEGK